MRKYLSNQKLWKTDENIVELIFARRSNSLEKLTHIELKTCIWLEYSLDLFDGILIIWNEF